MKRNPLVQTKVHFTRIRVQLRLQIGCGCNKSSEIRVTYYVAVRDYFLFCRDFRIYISVVSSNKNAGQVYVNHI